MKRVALFFETNFATLALMLICLAAYAPLLPFNGFYGDEWQIVYEYMLHKSAGLITYLYYDGHPLAALSYVFSFNLLGAHPFAWQVYSLTLRLLSILAFWMVLRRVWPQRPRETWMVALLFAIYPQFHLQAQAVAYFEVWLSYIFLWLSFYFSIRSLQEPRRFWAFTLLAVLFKLCHPLSSEYTWGTEMMRPLLLWFALGPLPREQVKAALRRVITVLWPHLLISAGIFAWRVLIYQSPTGYRADPRLLESLINAPWSTLRSLILYLTPDAVLILFTSWQKVFQPATFDFGKLFNVLGFLFALAAAVIAWLFLNRERESENSSGWISGALLTGGATAVFGMLPFYVGGYFPSTGIEPWSGRFILGSLPGLALLVVALIVFFIPEKKRQVLFFALLTGLMVAWQLQAGNEFRRLWTTQSDFYRELLWRAPALKRNTAIIVDSGTISLIRGSAYTLNGVYEQAPTADGQLAYWLFGLGDPTIPLDFSKVVNATELKNKRFTTFFSGDSQDALAVDFRPDDSRCLWVLNPDQILYTLGNHSFESANSPRAFARISENSDGSPRTLDDLFGSVKLPAWCYYFEKADLARQTANWPLAVSLWEQVEEQQIKPLHGLEYLPFIESYARLNDWEKAYLLTRQANRASSEMESALCPFWERLDRELPSADGKSAAVQKARDLLVCKQ